VDEQSRLAGLEANGWDSIFARLPSWHRDAQCRTLE